MLSLMKIYSKQHKNGYNEYIDEHIVAELYDDDTEGKENDYDSILCYNRTVPEVESQSNTEDKLYHRMEQRMKLSVTPERNIM